MVRFSTGISKIGRLDKLPAELNFHLKYLFNYHRFDFYYVAGNSVDCISISLDGFCYFSSGVEDLPSLERGVLQSGVPKAIVSESDQLTSHCWKFENGNNLSSLIKIQSTVANPFKESSITLVKVVNKTLATKVENLKMIQLIHRQNKQLEELARELQTKNSEIESLNQIQEGTIADRTASLLHSNTKLKSLIQFNSHQLREPLTRVISMVEIKDELSTEEYVRDILPLMHLAVSDLDKAVMEVIRRSEELE
ncbi:hypothetical protein [Lunatibacter salilacus]|uniref:hypothetical protein n=1 Tax=Lunatibacter salilacus TaxID=2483804 RepID=UPI00131AE67E|nr:hypothetical protein [Lunatibacter salilacus]